MVKLFEYIVFIFCCFNIFQTSNAEIILDIPEDEFEISEKTPFFNVGSLPQPVHLRQILAKQNNSALSNIAILGRYFDAKYKKDALERDLRAELALIFPELSDDEIDKLSYQIKTVILIYREGKKKYHEVTQNLTTPKDPPLIVDDDEYAVLGDTEFIPVEEGKYAVITDFKKVIGYGNNPREIEAMEAKIRRDEDKKRKKTDFEKFKEMWDKIEFSKLTSYGVTEPNPFVGNAGIGDFTDDDDGYRARLVSEFARIGDKQEFLAALHIIVPNHRFMSAVNGAEGLKKPEIKLKNTENIADYEVFYPLAIGLSGDKMIGAYRGDFAFPIKIRLKDAQKPVSLDAEILFTDCDFEPVCRQKSLTTSLKIDVDDANQHTLSSMATFVRQSFYHIPQQNNKYFKLERVSTNKTGDKLYFEFSYHAEVKNFALILENEAKTSFFAPKITIFKNRIYAEVSASDDTQNLGDIPLLMHARLNDYADIAMTLRPSDFKAQADFVKLPHLILFAFFVGLLFYLTPYGAAMMFTTLTRAKLSAKNEIMRISSQALILAMTAFFLGHLLLSFPDVVFVNLKNNFFYLSLNIAFLIIWLLGADKDIVQKQIHPIVQGGINAFLIMFFFIFGATPYMQTFVLKISNNGLQNIFVAGFGLITAFMVPDMLFYALQKRGHLSKILHHSVRFALILSLGLSFFYLLRQNNVINILKILFLSIIAAFVFEYIINFLDALYRANLSAKQVSTTKCVMIVFLLLSVFLFARQISFYQSDRTQNQPKIAFSEISNLVNQGKNVLISIDNKACLLCFYNNLTVLNRFNIERIQKQYDFEYITIDDTHMTPDVQEFLKRYKTIGAPLYVLYTPLVPNGVVLPSFLKETTIETTLKNFEIHK